jgi:hypothetical protein
MRIIGYGEDGLTYWAISTQLQQLLDALEGPSDKNNCTIFYRPSFGRSGGDTSSQFGEFDAILATQKSVYLIESKWDHLSDQERPVVVLGDVQILRHRIFTWLRDEWRNWRQDNPANPPDWAFFWNAKHKAFTDAFRNRPLAKAETLLARNLAHVLLALEGAPKPTVNVLLYFSRGRIPAPQRVVNAQPQAPDPPFVLVCLPYQTQGISGYFELV